MCEVAEVTTNLRQVAADLWVSGREGEVSYPPGAHASCFAVEDTSFWFRHRRDVVTWLITERIRDETFFDIGGGNGYVSLALQQAGIRSVMVEPGCDGIRNARERGVRCLVHSTFEGAGFRPASVGAFGLFDVLEHVESDTLFLSKVCNALRPGGHLFLTVPASPALWSSEDVTAGHYRRYTVGGLTGVLARSGFDVQYCTYFFGVLAPAVLVGRAVPSWLGIRKPSSPVHVERDHATRGGPAGWAVQRALAWELTRLRSGGRMPFGSSCVAVARRLETPGGK